MFLFLEAFRGSRADESEPDMLCRRWDSGECLARVDKGPRCELRRRFLLLGADDCALYFRTLKLEVSPWSILALSTHWGNVWGLRWRFMSVGRAELVPRAELSCSLCREWFWAWVMCGRIFLRQYLARTHSLKDDFFRLVHFQNLPSLPVQVHLSSCLCAAYHHPVCCRSDRGLIPGDLPV